MQGREQRACADARQARRRRWGFGGDSLLISDGAGDIPGEKMVILPAREFLRGVGGPRCGSVEVISLRRADTAKTNRRFSILARGKGRRAREGPREGLTEAAGGLTLEMGW